MSASSLTSDRRFFVFNGAISVAALALLGWLLLLRSADGSQIDLRFMPAVNAALNAFSVACLVAGYAAVKRGRSDIHRYLMVAAFVASSLFLVGYVAYHYAHGDTKFTGEGAARLIYFAVLISHVLLSMAVVPLVLTVLYYAARGQFDRHRRVARVTFPIWLYVSVTGVVIYFMLHGGLGA